MAIIKRYRKKGIVYQVRLRDSEGKQYGDTFKTKKEAIAWELQEKDKMIRGEIILASSQKALVDGYWNYWIANVSRSSNGWKKKQKQMYRDYIKPVIGHLKIINVSAVHQTIILKRMSGLNRSPQTQLHVYNLLHKMFHDSITLKYRITNPISKDFRPQLIEKEATYLDIEESILLLKHVEDLRFGLAIWIQILCGFRACEVSYLKWKHYNEKTQEFMVCGTYRRSESCMIDYPKEKKDRPVAIPGALCEKLSKLKKLSNSEYIVTMDDGVSFMSYNSYYPQLKKYLEDVGIYKDISTHGLRHSTYEFYMQHGATEKDMQVLFNHGSVNTTKRYIHGKYRRDRDGINKAVKKIKI